MDPNLGPSFGNPMLKGTAPISYGVYGLPYFAIVGTSPTTTNTYNSTDGATPGTR